jgi:hypothetical protein
MILYAHTPYKNYVVSDIGDVFKISPRGDYTPLKKHSDRDGYMKVTIISGHFPRGRKIMSVHRLVMEGFYGASELHVNHKNGLKWDNCLINLEYVTPSQNRKHAYDTGLQSAKGELNGKAILANSEVLEILELLNSGERVGHIAKRFGAHQTTISHIKSGKMWSSVTGIVPKSK